MLVDYGGHVPQYEATLRLQDPPPAGPARLSIELFRAGEGSPHRSLHLLVQTVS